MRATDLGRLCKISKAIQDSAFVIEDEMRIAQDSMPNEQRTCVDIALEDALELRRLADAFITKANKVLGYA